MPWRAPSPARKNVWYDLVLYEKLSDDSSVSYAELWMNNYHEPTMYRERFMFDVVTLYVGEHQVGTSFVIVAPKSH